MVLDGIFCTRMQHCPLSRHLPEEGAFFPLLKRSFCDNILTTFFKKRRNFCHVHNEHEEPKTIGNTKKAAISGGFRMVELRGIEPRSDNRTLSLLRA